MIKSFPTETNLCANVTLKDGREFLNCDLPTHPFGEHSAFVSFWHNGALLFIPPNDVKELAIFESKNE